MNLTLTMVAVQNGDSFNPNLCGFGPLSLNILLGRFLAKWAVKVNQNPFLYVQEWISPVAKYIVFDFFLQKADF